jgi:hypothetical protein
VFSLVISEGALQTTTFQVFVLPLVPKRADSASHREVLAKLVAGLLEAMRQRRVAEFCISLGAEQTHLSDLSEGLLVNTLRRLNEVLELKPNLAGVGLNLNAIIDRILGPAARPLSPNDQYAAELQVRGQR